MHKCLLSSPKHSDLKKFFMFTNSLKLKKKTYETFSELCKVTEG